MDEVEIACPHCRETSVVSRAMLGKRGLCPRCRRPIEVPDDAPEAPAAFSGKQIGGPVRDEPVPAPARDTRPCPSCGEPILKAAVKCRHCGEFLDGHRRPTGGGDVSGAPPPNHLVLAIATTFCCCVPFGIVSIVYATQVESRWRQGDAHGAHEASRKASFWATLGIVLGLLVNLGFVVLSALG